MDPVDVSELIEHTVTRWSAGEISTDDVRLALQTARDHSAAYSQAAQRIAKLIVESGGSESAAARELGLDRMTVRRALGKL